MSGFNLEEFKRGVPACDRLGKVWIFDRIAGVEELYSNTHPLHSHSVKAGGMNIRHMLDGRSLGVEDSPYDLITMADNDTVWRVQGVAENSKESDPVNHPAHYTSHPSGIECIQITEHMGFNLGNAMKYVWRADLKGDAIDDLKKAAWYINREIEKREKVK